MNPPPPQKPAETEAPGHSGPIEIPSYVRKLRVELAHAGMLAAALVAYSLMASSLTNGAYTVPTVSSGSLAAGYGILATLVVAIQVMARGVDRAKKLENPTANWMTHNLASLVLFGSMALAVLGILGSFSGPLDLPLYFPRTDTVRLVGSVLFSALTALPAAEAKILTEALPEQQRDQRERALEEARHVKASYPGKQPGKIVVGIGWLTLVVVAPVAASVAANLIWKGSPADAVMLGFVAATSEIVLFQLLKGAITALHSNRRLSLAGYALGCSALTAGPLVLSLASGSHDALKAGFALSMATTVPLVAGVLCCLPTHGVKLQRGIVLQSAVKSTERRIRSLEQAGETMREHGGGKRKLDARWVAAVATFVLCPPLGILLIVRWIRRNVPRLIARLRGQAKQDGARAHEETGHGSPTEDPSRESATR